MGKERRYCKNKTKGSHPGRKWDEKTRTGVLMDMIASNNICAVARKWGVPESTIRTWIAKEMEKPAGASIYEQARREAARQVAAAAAASALQQVGYLARRIEANARNAEICEGLAERLRQDVRARSWDGVGKHLSTEREKAEAAEAGALVPYGALGSYDRALSDEERAEIERMLELHAPMDDKSATMMAQALTDIAARAAAMSTVAQDDAPESGEAPVLYMSEADAQAREVEVDE